MSILATYREKEELMRKLQSEISKLEENQQLKKELEFKKEVEACLDRHGKTLNDLLDVFGLAPSAAGRASASTASRRTRKMKVYVNPNTQERIETRGGNHKLLKAWKKQHGAETVEGWLVAEQD